MSNLPEGVTTSMIPGNRPDEVAAEAAMDNLMDRIIEAGIQPHEYEAFFEGGLGAVKASRKLSEDARADERANMSQTIEYLKSRIADHAATLEKGSSLDKKMARQLMDQTQKA